VNALAGDFSQGFYFSRPMTGEMVDDLTGKFASAWMITDHRRGQSLQDAP